PGNLVQDRKHKEHGAEQKFVGNRIQVLSEHGLLFQGARQQAIQPIAETRNYEQDQRPLVVPVELIDHDERQKHHPQQRELVWSRQELGKFQERSSREEGLSALRVKTVTGSSPVLVVKR